MRMSEARAGGMEGRCLSEMDRQFAGCIVGELPRTRAAQDGQSQPLSLKAYSQGG